MSENQKITKNKYMNLLAVPYIAAFLFLFLTLVTAGNYGYFCDELYYIACSKHLAFGYVDQPPVVVFLAFIIIKIFGESLIGLRLVSGIVGAATVVICSQIAKSLGGGRYAQSLAALLILFSGGFLGVSNLYSMNPIDIFLCSLFILTFIKIIKNPSPTKWILLGIILGVALLNKYTIIILGFSLLIALILTKRWIYFKFPWIYLSGLIGISLFLPHIIWQINHDFPTLEWMRNVTVDKNLSLSPLAFIMQVIFGLNPLAFPIWFLGLAYLLIGKSIKKYQPFGWAVLIFFLVYMVQNSKAYYILPIIPLLFASGANVIELLIQRYHIYWLKWVITIFVIISGALLMPHFIPILPVEKFISYSKFFGAREQTKMEKWESDELPIYFKLRFGWPELVETVAEVYHSLPDEEKNVCAILTKWYGPAGAIDHFGTKHGLPKAISGYNNYWTWGIREYTGECIISVGLDIEQMKKYYNTVNVAANFEHKYAPGATICICKEPKFELENIWDEFKVYR